VYIIIVYAYVYILHSTESATIHNTTILLAYLSTCDGWYLIHSLMLCLQQDMTWITKDCSISDSIDSKIIPLKSICTNILTVRLSSRMFQCLYIGITYLIQGWISHCLGYQNCHFSYTRQCRYVTLQLLWKEGNHCPWPCCQLCNKLGQLSHIINSNNSVISCI